LREIATNPDARKELEEFKQLFQRAESINSPLNKALRKELQSKELEISILKGNKACHPDSLYSFVQAECQAL